MTKKTEQKGSDQMLLLTESHDVIAGSAWSHCLYGVRDGDKTAFRITVSGDGERSEAFAGYELTRALAAFQMLVRGRVTACTLCDVIEDGLFSYASAE